jgi:MAE_28990/MAE_18760-like HEPN
MSEIRTFDDLTDCLSKDLAWRKIELSSMKGLIQLRKTGMHENKALTRSGITLLYAHWEGYIKRAATAYLEFVSRQKQLNYCDLADNFIAIAMKSRLDAASKAKANQSTIHNEVVKFLIESMNERIVIPRNNVIDTRSNLSFDVLSQILALLGIDNHPYEMRRVLIDEKLLAKRNCIAHGDFLDVDINSYQELHRNVVEMMDLFKDQIENHAVQKLYLRSSESTVKIRLGVKEPKSS